MNFINFSCINTPRGGGGANVLGIAREQKCPNTPSLYERVIMYVHNCIKYFTQMMEKRKEALQS